VHPTAARVQERLHARGLGVEVQVLPDSARTAVEAAAAVGCDLGQIVKSLVFDVDGRLVVALTPGDRRADPQRVAAAVGARRARVASPEQVLEATGFAPGVARCSQVAPPSAVV